LTPPFALAGSLYDDLLQACRNDKKRAWQRCGSAGLGAHWISRTAVAALLHRNTPLRLLMLGVFR